MNFLSDNGTSEATCVNSSRFCAGVDFLSKLAGLASAMALLAIVSFVCFEVVSRYAFNEPTVWVNEYSTYLLLGIAFVGLAYAQKENSHIQVELLLGYVPEATRRKMELLTLWIGLFFVVFAAWQVISFNYQEYINDTRNWGLLATPQWIPELFVSVGYGLFMLAILADIARQSGPVKPWLWWVAPFVFVALIQLEYFFFLNFEK